MRRRRFIVGLSGLAGGASLILGTGAFSSVSAERRIFVQTAGDNDALLSLSELGEGSSFIGGRSIENGGPKEKVAFSFPGTGKRIADPDLGLGIGSIYKFDRDSGESGDSSPTEGLLRIENQGTQPVEIYSEHETSSEIEIEIYDVDTSDDSALRESPVTLTVGEFVDVGFRLRTFDANPGTFEETLTIIAEASN
jgi:hypothetical protein